MATVAELKAHLSGAAPATQSAAKVAALKKYGAITGAFAGNAGAGYQAPPSAADSAWGGLKAVGSNTLHALTVPQAAIFTTAAKASGKNLSWKNVLGDFRKDAAGRTGGDAALNSMGVHNALARLGISLVADPLWFVGGGLVKGAKAGEEAAKVLNTASAAEDALKVSRETINKIARNAARSKDPSAAARYVRAIEKEKVKMRKLEATVADEQHAKQVEKTPFTGLLKTDPYGNITNKEEGLAKVRAALTQDQSRKGMNYAVRVGAGKFSKKLDLGISAERALIGKNLRAGFMAMKPVEKVAHGLRRSGAEMAEAIDPNVLTMAEKYGLTHATEKGGIAINPEDAQILGMARSLRSVNDPSGKALIDYFRSKGLWHEGHDAVMREMDTRYDYLKGADKIGKDDEKAFAAQYKALDKREKSAQEILKKAEKDGAGTVTKATEKANAELEAVAKERAILDERGAYTHQGRRVADLADDLEARKRAVQSGLESPAHMHRTYTDPKKAAKARAMFDNPFKNVTHDQMIEDMTAAGIDEETAQGIVQTIDSALTAKGIESFREAEGHAKYLPEWNAFTLYAGRENDHIWRQVDTQIEQLAKEAGVGKKSDLYQALKFHHTGGPLAKSQGGQFALQAVAKFKGLLTFVNPSHYVRNLTGDYWNSMVNGTFKHASPTSPLAVMSPRSDTHRLANAQVWAGEGRQDAEALARIHRIGDKDYTGADLLAMSRMVGLGRGYVGTDIAIMGEAFARAKGKPGEFYKFMQRMNVKRENAQRMHTWIAHMEAGDDPIIAGVKTLRVHFDYTQLTGFERLMLRNVLLFYTWMKRNMILQATGVVTRPGLYAAAAHMEAARPKIPNEPDYYKKQGAIPIPGFGALNVGSPVGDLWKLEFSLAGFRRDVLGAVTPPIRVPTELATNQKFFTGGQIQQYQGQVTQSALADALNKVGIPVGKLTTAKAGGGKSYGINPQLAYVLSQVTGPQAGTVQTLSSPDYEGNKLQEGLQRFIGVSKQANRPAQFARAVKYKEAKKKADATRAKNAQRGN